MRVEIYYPEQNNTYRAFANITADAVLAIPDVLDADKTKIVIRVIDTQPRTNKYGHSRQPKEVELVLSLGELKNIVYVVAKSTEKAD